MLKVSLLVIRRSAKYGELYMWSRMRGLAIVG